MQAFTQLITFKADINVSGQITSSAQQITVASCIPACNNSLTNVAEIYVEQLASNSHNAYVLLQPSVFTVLSAGTGVVSQLSIPAATESTNGVSLPSWSLQRPHNSVDLTKFWFHGTSGEAVKVTFFVED